MRAVIYFSMFVVFLFSGGRCIAQSEARISNTNIQLKGNQVHISYDILCNDPNIRFEVWIEISESNGRALEVNALTGDIGSDITSGTHKVIVWDPATDNINENILIDIQVYANPISGDKALKRSSLIMQSVFLPGLGLSRVSGKPHWIKGVLGYGCLGGSIALNKMAVASYDDYGSADSSEDADILWEATVQQNNISKGLAFGAIAIWITDIAWTIIGTSDLKKNSSNGDSKGLSLGTGYDNISKTPMLSFNYKF